MAVPTDSSYALVCHLDDKNAVDRLRRIRQVDERHHLTLLCADLSEVANYAKVDNQQYRLLKLATPGYSRAAGSARRAATRDDADLAGRARPPQ